jgi:hypothetical protein
MRRFHVIGSEVVEAETRQLAAERAYGYGTKAGGSARFGDEEASWGVWCTVSGAITGDRANWLTRGRDCAIVTFTEAAARAKADDLNPRDAAQSSRPLFIHRIPYSPSPADPPMDLTAKREIPSATRFIGHFPDGFPTGAPGQYVQPPTNSRRTRIQPTIPRASTQVGSRSPDGARGLKAANDVISEAVGACGP